jgi:ribonuclease P protein component
MAARFWPGAEPRAAGSSFHSDCAHLICSGAVRERLRLPAERRIRRKSDFDAAYAHGQRLGNGFFAVTVYSRDPGRPHSDGPRVDRVRSDGARSHGGGRVDGERSQDARLQGPRIGLAVAVRIAGGSVQRNRIRRVIRESFRLHQHELPAADLVVSARARSRDASGPELHAALAALWKKVAQRCATSLHC